MGKALYQKEVCVCVFVRQWVRKSFKNQTKEKIYEGKTGREEKDVYFYNSPRLDHNYLYFLIFLRSGKFRLVRILSFAVNSFPHLLATMCSRFEQVRCQPQCISSPRLYSSSGLLSELTFLLFRMFPFIPSHVYLIFHYRLSSFLVSFSVFPLFLFFFHPFPSLFLLLSICSSFFTIFSSFLLFFFFFLLLLLSCISFFLSFRLYPLSGFFFFFFFHSPIHSSFSFSSLFFIFSYFCFFLFLLFPPWQSCGEMVSACHQ